MVSPESGSGNRSARKVLAGMAASAVLLTGCSTELPPHENPRTPDTTAPVEYPISAEDTKLLDEIRDQLDLENFEKADSLVQLIQNPEVRFGAVLVIDEAKMVAAERHARASEWKEASRIAEMVTYPTNRHVIEEDLHDIGRALAL